MPIHDFHCRACNKDFELLVRSTTVPACPACGGREIDKLVSLTAPAGKSAGIISGVRAQAAREGHFSNYSNAERRRG